MKFTFDGYRSLLKMLTEHGYNFAGFDDYAAYSRCVILRHDIDFNLENALAISKIEKDARRDICGSIRSTFLFMLSSEFYNIFTRRGREILREIHGQGHEIGLHFDAAECTKEDIIDKIQFEAEILSNIMGEKVKTVSMHNPDQTVLEANLEIPAMINAYGYKFFKEFKYVSDSSRHWREPVEEYIKREEYKHLQILTHPFWYKGKEESYKESVLSFINSANRERYGVFLEVIPDFTKVIREEDVR